MSHVHSSFRRPVVVSGVLLIAAVLSLAGASSRARTSDTPPDRVSRKSYGIAPAFEENRGQAPGHVRFLARLGQTTAAITPKGVSVRVAGAKERDYGFSLVGANDRAKLVKRDKAPGVVNYLLGSDRSRWIRKVSRYREVVARGVYPGVDLIYHFGNAGLPSSAMEYDFVVAPGTEPSAIRLRLNASEPPTLNRAGDLVWRSEKGEVRQTRPVAYQSRPDGSRDAVDASFQLASHDPRYVSFELGEFDRSRPLVIDPVIVYSSYLGGAAADTCFGVAVNEDGEAFVTGSTFSLDLPTTEDAFQPEKAGASASIDAFVARFSAAGDELIYATYLGGTSDDEAFGIAVGSDDRAVLTGSTLSTNFPTTTGAFDRTYHGLGDAFVARLSADGIDLSFSTFIGGAGNDVANGIALDTSRRAYITGYTESNDFPTTAGVIDRGFGGFRDAFVTRLTLNGDDLLASTYLGGGGVDDGRALAVADSGAVVLTGATESDNFPSTGTSFEPFRLGTTDAFVVRLSQDLSDFDFGGFLGGLNLDAGTAIALDDDGNVGVAGETASNGLAVTAEAFDQTFNGGTRDAFVARITPLGDAISYCTYLGGTSDDGATGIAFDPAGNLHVSGFTQSIGFPVVDPLFDDLQGGYDAFVAEILPSEAGDASLRWSTFFGGEDDDSANAIALTPGSSTATFIAGETLSDSFPVEGGVQAERAGQSDGFLAKVSRQAPLAAPTNLQAVAAAGRVDLTWNDNSTGETGFQIERKTASTEFVRIATTAANDEAFADTDVDPTTAYTYRVRAVSSDNASPYSNEASATTPDLDVPTAPNNLTAVAVSESEIDLEWVDRSDNETGFKIERRQGTTGTFAQIDTVDANIEVYNDTGLLSDTTYQYRVRAFNADGNSDYSNVATATTFEKGGGPNAPSALRATINGSRSITLTWQDNANNESGFQLERATGIGDFVRIATLGPNTTTFTDNTLQPNTVYRYRVRALNENGVSNYSNTVQVRTPVDPPTEPAAPTNLVAEPTAGQVLLTWDDNSTNESTFAIERKLEDGGFQPLTSVGQNVERFVDQTGGGNARYTYRVRAVNTGGESAYASSGEILTLPTAPTTFTAAPTSPTSIQLTWRDTNVRPADTRIERSEDGGTTFEQIAQVDAGRTSFSDEGLEPNNKYHYRIRSTNPSGNSAFSATVSATTPKSDGGRLIVRKRLNFGAVRRGSAKVKSLTISNASTTQTLSVTVGEVNSPFRIVSGGGELAIPPSGSRTVQIEFQPRGRGKSSRNLRITSSDSDRPRVTVKLTGSGR